LANVIQKEQLLVVKGLPLRPAALKHWCCMLMEIIIVGVAALHSGGSGTEALV